MANHIGQEIYRQVFESTLHANDMEFNQLLSLCKNPKEVGIKLLSLIQNEISLITKETPKEDSYLAKEVDILIMIHVCFVLSCSMNGIDAILSVIKNRVNVYTVSNQYKLLVKLLINIKNYSELQYIIKLIIE